MMEKEYQKLNIKISHETPLQLLEESLIYNDYQYILPYFWDRYTEYKEWMLQYSKKENSFIILDNGLFEGEVPTIPNLLKLIDEIQPNIFIPPDEWNDSLGTLKNAKYWMGLKKAGNLPEKTQLMVVVQGKTFGEMEILYQQCVDLGYTHFSFNHSSIAYQSLGHSTELMNASFGRNHIITNLIDKGVIKKEHYIHLLGLSTPTELGLYSRNKKEYINSIDTSSPIILGCKREKYYYKSINLTSKPKEKLEHFFESTLDFEQKEYILDNIEKFRHITNNITNNKHL